MTATRQKKAAHMPARASVPPRLFMKNGNVERLMMWFVNTQRFTRMMSTRSRVHSLHCGRAGLAELCMRIPFVETAFGRPRRSSGPVNRTYATGPLIDGKDYIYSPKRACAIRMFIFLARLAAVINSNDACSNKAVRDNAA